MKKETIIMEKNMNDKVKFISELDGVADEQERNMKTWDNVEADIDNSELVAIIEANLPISLKPDFIRLRYDVKMPKVRKEKILEVIRKILAEKGLDEPETW
jgi:hypothetical protein